MSKNVQITTVNRNCIIVLLHYSDDVCSWIVRKYRRVFFIRKRLLSVWFNDRAQAVAYIRELIRICETEKSAAV